MRIDRLFLFVVIPIISGILGLTYGDSAGMTIVQLIGWCLASYGFGLVVGFILLSLLGPPASPGFWDRFLPIFALALLLVALAVSNWSLYVSASCIGGALSVFTLTFPYFRSSG